MKLGILGLALLAACTSTESAPRRITAEVEPVEAPPTVAPPPTVSPPTVAPPPAPPTVAETPSSEEEHPALARALHPEAPDAIAIDQLVAQADGRIVLYRFRGAVAWRARARAQGTLDSHEREIEAKRERCDTCDGEVPAWQTDACHCRTRAASDPFVAAEGIMDDPFVWEIARLLPESDGTWKVAARTRLSDLSLDSDVDGELELADLDADGAAEIHVQVFVAPPTCRASLIEHGALGYVLRSEDVGEQFAYTSSHSIEDMSDEIGDDPVQHRETTITLEPSAGELQLERTVEMGESEIATKLVCPYSRATDTWTCPDPQPEPPFWRMEPRTDCRSIGVKSWARCKPAQPARCKQRGA